MKAARATASDPAAWHPKPHAGTLATGQLLCGTKSALWRCPPPATPISIPPGHRLYACTSCQHEQTHEPAAFASGTAPLCQECFGTLRRTRLQQTALKPPETQQILDPNEEAPF